VVVIDGYDKLGGIENHVDDAELDLGLGADRLLCRGSKLL
jgi:hypothetical protein